VAAEYVGGIVEFMGSGFLKEYHSEIYKAGNFFTYCIYNIPYVSTTRTNRDCNLYSLPNGLKTGVPPGNISSVDWSTMKKVTAVDCVPLNLLLHKAHVRHINFFILDVEASSILFAT
jgi:hypothetical protein